MDTMNQLMTPATMTDHANELRRHARKIPHPQGETPGVMQRAADEIERLRAKIEQMEQQEPVRWFYVTNGEWDCYSRERPPEDAYDAGSLMALYALPGAKGD